ncbi:MAG TPA: ribonuclease R [Gammaproteobacteria bacterium]|nr:ribonuclease R [Gammaproteobacteria bacterium]
MSKKKKINKYIKDPFGDREAKRYEKPIPSREFILEILLSNPQPIPQKKLAKILALTDPDQQEALRRRLNAMVRECQIALMPKGYTALTMFKEQTGILKVEKDGFGTVSGEETKVKLPPREIRGFYTGDKLRVRITRYDFEGQAFGSVIELIQATIVKLVGRFTRENGHGYVVVLGKKYAQDIHIPQGKSKQAQDGEIVQVVVDRRASTLQVPVGHIEQVLGEPDREGIEIDVAILKYQVPYLWQKGVEHEAKKFGKSIPKREVSEREDLTHLPLVTIDGEHAKDFDDAVFCETRKNGWRLYVAIADVSHYVLSESKLDLEASTRGNSVYFPGKVIPMLPEHLSNGLCSLMPNVERLVLVCEMLITQSGSVTRSKFYPAVIRSRAQLTYTLVSTLLKENQSVPKQYAELYPHLKALEQLYYALDGARRLRGAIDFNSVETQIVFDKKGKIAGVVARERTIAHKIIEECMLAANVSAARFLKRHKIPTLYRVHLPPPEEKLNALRDFLAELGLGLRKRDFPTSKDYSELIHAVQTRDDVHIIETVMLRSMAQAEYNVTQEGHFGLAFPAYLHFTSPIRRYPDLIVHRQIKAILAREKINRDAWHEKLSLLGSHCSMTERRADDATREVALSLKCQFMAERVGEIFQGRISAVTAFGLFVELEDFYVEGLIHVATLGDDYYFYEPFKHRMIGERTRKIYSLGDKLEVQIMRVDVEDKKIDLEIVGAQKTNAQSAIRKRKGTKRKRNTDKRKKRY